MHWTEAIASRPHSRVLHYLMDDEHEVYGPPSLEHIAAELGTDHRSAWNIVRPLVDGGMVTMEADPRGGAMFSVGEVG